MATRPKFAKMANYSCECVECESHFSRNDLWRMSASLASHGILANFANLANFKARSFYVQKKIFLGIKQSSLSSPNSPDSPNSLNSLNLLNTRQIRRSESQKFAQYSPNLPERVTKIWRIFGEYSNLLNSPASGHCLI